MPIGLAAAPSVRIEAGEHESVLAVQGVGLWGPAATTAATIAAAAACHQTDSDQCEGTKNGAFHQLSWYGEIQAPMTNPGYPNNSERGWYSNLSMQ